MGAVGRDALHPLRPVDPRLAPPRRRPEEAAAVIGGQVLPVADITGVLTRLPAVQPEDLAHIATADRDYVASEMTAFLIAFVSALPCRVLDRPSAGALSGPAWRRSSGYGPPPEPGSRSVRANGAFGRMRRPNRRWTSRSSSP